MDLITNPWKVVRISTTDQIALSQQECVYADYNTIATINMIVLILPLAVILAAILVVKYELED